MIWGHDELANDLARHLRGTSDRVVWTDMQLGPSGSPRPDVYTIPKTYSRFTPLAYEIKVSVSDFRRDVTAGKWQSYLKFACAVTFAVPAGLIKKEDIPPGCGLIVRHDEIWRTVKAPTLRKIDTLPHDAWMKLFIDGMERQQKSHEPRNASIFHAAEKLRKKHGKLIGDALYELGHAELKLMTEKAKIIKSTEDLMKVESDRVKFVRERLQSDIEELKKQRADLCKFLGISENSSGYSIHSAIEKTIERLAENSEIARLRRLLASARSALDDGLSEPAIIQATMTQQAPTNVM